MMRPMAIGNIRGARLESIDEARRRWNEVSYGHANGHREENPERKETVKKRELLTSSGSANLPVCAGSVRH